MSLQRLLEEGRGIAHDPTVIGGTAWKERRLVWLRKEMFSALPIEDWRDLDIDPFQAEARDLDRGHLVIQTNAPNYLRARFDEHGVRLEQVGNSPHRVLQHLHPHHPVENHRQLVLWLADIFPTTKEEITNV
jgi:hypothetical protein